MVLSEEEYTQIRNNAGLVPLSRFLKNLGLAKNQASPILPETIPSWKELLQDPMEKFAENLNAVATDHRAEDVPRNEKVSPPKRSAARFQRIPAPIEPCKHGAYPGFCKHEECRK